MAHSDQITLRIDDEVVKMEEVKNEEPEREERMNAFDGKANTVGKLLWRIVYTNPRWSQKIRIRSRSQ